MSNEDATAVPAGSCDTGAWRAAVRAGDPAAADRLLPLVYDELRRIARAALSDERPDHTLDPTALVHEAFLKLFGAAPVHWRDRVHFLATASSAMRHVLVDHARARECLKRGGAASRVSITGIEIAREGPDPDLLALDEALERLEADEPEIARVVELRYFGGLEDAEIAALLGVSDRTVRAHASYAKAWLYRELVRGTYEGESGPRADPGDPR